MLTNEEKIAIANSHKRNLAYTQYGVELNLKEENAKSTPNESAVEGLNKQLEDLKRQAAILDAEIASLS
jgi:hypothetical protein